MENDAVMHKEIPRQSTVTTYGRFRPTADIARFEHSQNLPYVPQDKFFSKYVALKQSPPTARSRLSHVVSFRGPAYLDPQRSTRSNGQL